MNANDDPRLEALIDSELKQLPELPAPATLVPRVFAALEQQATRPWYRQAWQAWPSGLQAVPLALLTALFIGLCFCGWHLAHTASASEAAQNARSWFAEWSVVGSTLAALGEAAVLTVKHYGHWLIAACVLSGLAAYLSCLGLGTAFMRLATLQR